MSLQEKVVKELGYGMSMPDQTDIAFLAVWVSRRADGSLTPTLFHMEEEPLSNELRERIATMLRNLAEDVEKEPVQESFQDAVKNDPDMTAEQKEYWLSQCPQGGVHRFGTQVVDGIEREVCEKCGNLRSKEIE